MLFLLLSCVNSTYIRFIADKHRENIIYLCERGKAEEAFRTIFNSISPFYRAELLTSRDKKGTSFLMHACRQDYEKVFTLLQENIYVSLEEILEQKDEDGRIAFDYAKNKEIMRLLVESAKKILNK